MARDGSGNYSLPAGQPVSTGTVISSTVFNTFTADVAAALTASLAKDGQTTPTANLPMGGFKHTGVADGNVRTTYASAGQVQDNTMVKVGSVAGTDTITGVLAPAITGYVAGMLVSLIVANTNATTTPTLALNGLTAKTIVRPDYSALFVGDLVINKAAVLYFDGTNFLLLNPAKIVSGTGLFADGTQGVPSMSFASDPNTGAYDVGPDDYGISVGGTLRFDISTTRATSTLPLTLPVGLVGTPSMNFAGDLTTGVYHPAASQFSITLGGAQAALWAGSTFNNVLTSFSTGGGNASPTIVFNGTVSSRDVQIQTSGSNRWIVRVTGTAEGGSNTGSDLQILRRDDTGAAIANALAISRSTGTWTLGDAVTNPAYSFLGTGAFSVGGAATFTSTVQTGNGSVGTPAHGFSGDPDNGLYYIGTNNWGLSAAGALVLELLSGKANYLTFEVGFRIVPQNAQSGNYTLVLADSGKHIFHASGDGAGDTYTIPANASVAYAIGTVLTFINADSNAVSIAITTDTMTLAGTTTTGTRTLGQNGIATATKMTATTWLISGTALS